MSLVDSVAHPVVRQCVVLGVPDERPGEIVAAAIVANEDCKLTPEELQGFLETRLGTGKIPSIWAFLESLPPPATANRTW